MIRWTGLYLNWPAALASMFGFAVSCLLFSWWRISLHEQDETLGFINLNAFVLSIVAWLCYTGFLICEVSRQCRNARALMSMSLALTVPEHSGNTGSARSVTEPKQQVNDLTDHFCNACIIDKHPLYAYACATRCTHPSRV